MALGLGLQHLAEVNQLNYSLLGLDVDAQFGHDSVVTRRLLETVDRDSRRPNILLDLAEEVVREVRPEVELHAVGVVLAEGLFGNKLLGAADRDFSESSKDTRYTLAEDSFEFLGPLGSIIARQLLDRVD